MLAGLVGGVVLGTMTILSALDFLESAESGRAQDVVEVAHKWNPMLFWRISIPEGRVGLLKWGRLTDQTYLAGNHWLSPSELWFSYLLLVNIRPQIDTLNDVSCGTSDGLTITFPSIDIYNQLRAEDALDIVRRFGENYQEYLITGPVDKAVKELCTTMKAREIYIEKFSELDEVIKKKLQEEQQENQSRLEIKRVVIEKPIIPESIRDNYLELVRQKSLREVAIEEQARRMKVEETDRMVMEQQAEARRTVAAIDNETALEHERNEAEKERIWVDVRIHQKKSEADADSYAWEKKAEAEACLIRANGRARLEISAQEAEVNKDLLTPAYIARLKAESFWNSNNAKYYFGNQVPQFIYGIAEPQSDPET